MCIEYCQSQKLTEALVCRFFVVAAICKHQQSIAQLIVPDDWYHMTPNPPSWVTGFVFFSVASCCPKQAYFYQVSHRLPPRSQKQRQFLFGQNQVLYHTISFTQVLQSVTFYHICFILGSRLPTPPLLLISSSYSLSSPLSLLLFLLYYYICLLITYKFFCTSLNIWNISCFNDLVCSGPPCGAVLPLGNIW